TPAEAGTLGTPLVLSDIPAHREVAGGHATFVPIDDVAALRAALAAVVADPARHRWELPWTWDDHARRLVSLFDSLVRTGTLPADAGRSVVPARPAGPAVSACFWQDLPFSAPAGLGYGLAHGGGLRSSPTLTTTRGTAWPTSSF